MTDAELIQQLKTEAIALNAMGDQRGLRAVIEHLDRIWHNHKAAYAFYTMLERTAPAQAIGAFAE